MAFGSGSELGSPITGPASPAGSIHGHPVAFDSGSEIGSPIGSSVNSPISGSPPQTPPSGAAAAAAAGTAAGAGAFAASRPRAEPQGHEIAVRQCFCCDLFQSSSPSFVSQYSGAALSSSSSI